MILKHLGIGLLVCFGSYTMHLDAAQDIERNEFEILMQKIRQDFACNPEIDNALDRYNEKDGSFTDVDYSSIQRTHWPPLVHVERISDFVFAYTNPENKYYQDSTLYKKIEKGLDFWHERNPWCHNWWYNQIAEPQKLGVLLIQMRAASRKLPLELEKRILDRIRTDGGDPAKWTGANRTDIALHWIYRACLTEDTQTLNYAMEQVYSPIVYTTKEGFQHDNSNFQHGPQLYIGGYGDEILKGVTQVAVYAQGTRFAIPEEKLQLISKFMRETYYPAIRGKRMLFGVMGRSVSRPGAPDKSHTALFAERMKILDEKHAREYQEIIDRLEGRQSADYALKPMHTHYFRGDYTLHVRPEYTFDVRMVSNRTMRCEYGNGENLKTYYVSDGSTNIVQSGTEYSDIFPVWNWARIPGTTAPQQKTIPKAASDWQTRGTSTFAGGVSDSLYGVSVYKYTDNYQEIKTGASKAWFFFDDEVVCLGAGISSLASEQVYTTINQTLLAEDPVTVSFNGKPESLSRGEETLYKNPDWVLHGGIGYVFPQGGNILVCSEPQIGTWFEINNSIANKSEIKKDVFTLAFNHGEKPYQANYAYLVVPNKRTKKELRKYLKKENITIAANDTNMQVVKHNSLDICQMVFYKPGKFQDRSLCIEVSRPCAVLLKKERKGRYRLHVADPGQTGKNIELKISTKKRNWQITFIPDKDPYAGATKAFTLE